MQVAIVGGGPAGSSAAFTLAAAGIQVCLVDRSVFPRDKLCGGLLTLRSRKTFQAIFKTDWSPVIQARGRGVEFFYHSTPLKSVADYKDVFFTCRKEFDAFLLDLARGAGATVLEGRRVEAVNYEKSELRLADGTALQYGFLIGADGVNSVVAKSILGVSFHKHSIGFGLEMEVPLSSGKAALANPEIHFGLLEYGYGWVFPKKETLTAGVGGLLRANPGMKEIMEAFLHRRFGYLPPGKMKGHFIPFGDFRSPPGKGNVLLCGDAAGLVEPITGEGIAFAMLSGQYAAESIREALSLVQPGSALALYEQRYERIAQSLRQAKLLRHLLFPRPCQFLLSKILPRSESVARRHLDLMADELSYRDFGRFLLKQACLAPLKVLSRSRATDQVQ